ncbi:MAG: hypothetical protein IPJ09_03255 [Saprospiraceae bacterium]|nr:hypothetical protein [Saprospiraceae bacterium]
MKVIEVKRLPNNTTYSTAKRKCKHYRISPNWLEDDVEYIPHFITTADLKVDDTIVCTQIKDVLNKLKIDHESQIIDNLIESRSKDRLAKKFRVENNKLSYKYRKKRYSKSFKKYNIEQYLKFEQINIRNEMRTALFYIENHLYYISKSNTNNRIHYNITTIPSELLGVLKIDNERLTELDLSNCQPLLLGYIINKTISNNKTILGDSFLVDIINRLIPLLFPSLLTDKAACHSDILVFIETTQQGQLYEYFANQLSAELPDKTPEERRQYAKNSFIKTLYSSNKYTSDEKEAFYRVFPDLSKLMESVKNELVKLFIEHERTGMNPDLERYTHSKNKSIKTPFIAGNDYLPIILQELESKIFIETCLPKLYENGLSVLPKHDSILCKVSDYQKVKEIFALELDLIFGLAGYHIKTKHGKEIPICQSICSNIQVDAA